MFRGQGNNFGTLVSGLQVIQAFISSKQRTSAVSGKAFKVFSWPAPSAEMCRGILGNGRNTVSRVLFRKREFTEFCSNFGEFGEELGEFAFAHKY